MYIINLSKNHHWFMMFLRWINSFLSAFSLFISWFLLLSSSKVSSITRFYLCLSLLSASFLSTGIYLLMYLGVRSWGMGWGWVWGLYIWLGMAWWTTWGAWWGMGAWWGKGADGYHSRCGGGGSRWALLVSSHSASKAFDEFLSLEAIILNTIIAII